jgi:hypothetical protein
MLDPDLHYSDPQPVYLDPVYRYCIILVTANCWELHKMQVQLTIFKNFIFDFGSRILSGSGIERGKGRNDRCNGYRYRRQILYFIKL